MENSFNLKKSKHCGIVETKGLEPMLYNYAQTNLKINTLKFKHNKGFASITRFLTQGMILLKYELCIIWVGSNGSTLGLLKKWITGTPPSRRARAYAREGGGRRL